ncbi:MAG: tripartite tricarboxylate transporter substrate-binding protein [Burkholderiaceae bacterium]
MDRATFLKSLAALAAAGAVPGAWAQPGANLKILIPASPGGGWDLTGRALGQAMIDAKQAATVTYDNKGGGAGVLGMGPFIARDKGDATQMMVMGAVMLGGLIGSRWPINLMRGTPLMRLTTEYNVFVLPANSPFKTMGDVIAQFKKDPESVQWGGGSSGSPEHIAAAMIASAVGVNPARVNYVASAGGGDAATAVLEGKVTIGGSGTSEFNEFIRSGRMKPVAVTSAERLAWNKDVPTLKEQGIDVEISNWRGLFGKADLAPAQRKALTDALIATTQSPAWQAALEKNGWTPAVLAGDEFTKFVESEFERLRNVMERAGMVVVPIGWQT